MNVALFHVQRQTQTSDDAYVWAKGLVASIRRTMQGVKIAHLTDDKSKAVKGVDAVRRKPAEPMGLLRMRLCAGLRGDWLVLDTDVIIERDCRWVFQKYDFDIGVAKRNWDHLRPAMGFSERMPYNTGVLFSRCPHFFAEAYTRLRNLDDEAQQWMGEQTVMNDIIHEQSHRYNIRFLSGNLFNFPPPVKDPAAKAKLKEILKHVHITHYKGERRKAALMERLACA